MPVTVELTDFLVVPDGRTTTVLGGDPRYPFSFFRAAWIPAGISPQFSVGQLPRFASELDGPFEVFAVAMVNYEEVSAKMTFRTRGDDPIVVESADGGEKVTVQFVPVVVEIELPADAFHEGELNQLVVGLRIVHPGTRSKSTFAERISLFYGGNERPGKNPCFQMDEPSDWVGDEFQRISSNSTAFTHPDSYGSAPVDAIDVRVARDAESIDLEWLSRVSMNERDEPIPELLILFRNDDYLGKTHFARHTPAVADGAAISWRQFVPVPLPEDEDYWEIWGIDIQFPYEPEVVYETSLNNPVTELNQSDIISAFGVTNTLDVAREE